MKVSESTLEFERHSRGPLTRGSSLLLTRNPNRQPRYDPRFQLGRGSVGQYAQVVGAALNQETIPTGSSN
jgi:hypothetical protein